MVLKRLSFAVFLMFAIIFITQANAGTGNTGADKTAPAAVAATAIRSVAR